MTPARFAHIVAAYGAEPRRWPADEQAEAQAYAAAWPQVADPLLLQASRLDQAMDADAAPRPSAALAARILAGRTPPAWRRWAVGLGAGLAVACAAGVVFGVGVSQTAVRDAHTDAVIAAGLGEDAVAGALASGWEQG